MKSIKKPVIPAGDGAVALNAIKMNLDVITGRIGGEVPPLADTATLADCIVTINLILAKINAST